MAPSWVVTGGAQGVGRAIVERLAAGDLSLHEAPPGAVHALIAQQLRLAVTGCAEAVRRFLAAGRRRLRQRRGGALDGGRAVLGQDPEARP